MGDVATLKLSEAARACGIETTTLAMLFEENLLGGSVRSERGHTYVREDAVPTYHQVIAALEKGLAQRLQRADRLLARVRTEIEAVGNDIALALENPYEELGEDVSAFDVTRRDNGTTLATAMRRLQDAVWAARRYNEALRRARTVNG
ncbi:hypothetical protein [Puerhibacterium sp. TATVAM-FAB25]|uniref:hypothetical protein n=1 Tax=Puerhibacterium sp. TATVAM-FAB25 TaxID=3093699 RepID=UPI00397AE13A